ncbi:glutamate racemase [Vogesella sp. LIG4]|uniref:glutamate racemase n=1 Tax=Vogesella sp. LIG4 TaxID=1192162 RepID=UPI00081FC681|nr:glutamate racemase [Vogesella sp. LIG4]SCK05013.1 glutamate racemase [Vogesella sp. LIG4]
MIGMFDSGLGGLSVWRQLVRTLPHESVLYLADQGYCPYGERSQAQIIARAEVITDYLLAQGATLLLIACNTATSAAVRHLRARYPQLPIVGMEPAIKPAVQATQSGRVGVLATRATLAGSKFRELAEQFRQQAQIVCQPGEGFVELVESGELASQQARDTVSQSLAPLLAAGVDHVVLGCTHYPFLAPLLRDLLPAHIDLIDPSDAVVRQTARLLTQHQLAAPADAAAAYRFVSTGDTGCMQTFMRQILGRDDAVEYLPLAG